MPTSKSIPLSFKITLAVIGLLVVAAGAGVYVLVNQEPMREITIAFEVSDGLPAEIYSGETLLGTTPLSIDYDKLLNATAEMKRLRKDKIDRNSPEGIRLCTNAADRVKKACEKVRTDKAYCSGRRSSAVTARRSAISLARCKKRSQARPERYA